MAAGDDGAIVESTLIPPMAPRLAAMPRETTTGHGATIRLSGWAASSASVDYQWSKDGVPIPGATHAELELTQATAAASGVYQLVASNLLGAAATPPVKVTVLPPSPADDWEIVRFPGTRVRLDRLAYGLGRFIATTPEGGLLTSTNGTHFSRVAEAPAVGLQSVRFIGGTFFALGDAGMMLRSINGVDWVTTQVPTVETLFDVTAGEGRLVAVGGKGVVLVSDDTVRWDRVASPLAEDLHGVAWHSTGFYAVGKNGTILYSWNGSSWIQEDSKTTANLRAIATDGDSLVVCGENNAIIYGGGWSWAPYSSGGVAPYHDVAFFGGYYDLVGPGTSARIQIRYNSSGNPSISTSSGEDSSQHYSGLAVSEDALFLAFGTAVLKRTTAPAWRPLGSPEYDDLNAVADGAGVVVAVGNRGTVITSEDGVSWKVQAPMVTSDLLAVTGTPSAILAVGNSGAILHSADGHSWTAVESGTSGAINDVCYGKERFVAAGSAGLVLTSWNGLNWVSNRIGSVSALTAVRFFDERFWALDSSFLYQSTDSTRWTSNRISGGIYPSDVAIGQAGVLVLAPDGLYQSPNGKDNWTFPSLGPVKLQRMVRFDGKIAAVGNGDQIWLSADDRSWYPRPSGQLFTLAGINSLRGALYAVGQYGVIVRSSSGTRLEVLRSGNAQGLQLRMSDGRAFQVEYSDALGHPSGWQLAPDARQNLAQPFQVNPPPSEASSRFYRAVVK